MTEEFDFWGLVFKDRNALNILDAPIEYEPRIEDCVRKITGGRMLHELKIRQEFYIRILSGEKTFEVRLNDRNYQKGDAIKFLPLESDSFDCYKVRATPHPNYEITYVQSGYGIESGFVILGIKEYK